MTHSLPLFLFLFNKMDGINLSQRSLLQEVIDLTKCAVATNLTAKAKDKHENY